MLILLKLFYYNLIIFFWDNNQIKSLLSLVEYYLTKNILLYNRITSERNRCTMKMYIYI